MQESSAEMMKGAGYEGEKCGGQNRNVEGITLGI